MFLPDTKRSITHRMALIASIESKLDDEDQATNEPINLLGLTRSEKETKSHIKYQDLKGKTMQKNVSMIGAVVVLLASCSFSFYFGSSLLCFRSFKV
ncbi:unnamed protein product [Brassica oleracea var. botrytis]